MLYHRFMSYHILLQRGRDHAIPNYNVFRKLCGLKSLSCWDKKPKEILSESWEKLRAVYRTPKDIELFPGGICEVPLKGAVAGATFNCLKVW
jgi:peroxidase